MNNNFEDYLPKIETIDLVCEKEQLFDYEWLFPNIPWSNHGGKNVKVTFDNIIKLHCIVLNGYDTKTAEHKEIEFDNVIIMAFHGTVTHYSFEFRLGEERICTSDDVASLGFDKESVKEKYITKLEQNIKGLQYQIGYKEDVIKLVKEL
jgi:hypothetical protein